MRNKAAEYPTASMYPRIDQRVMFDLAVSWNCENSCDLGMAKRPGLRTNTPGPVEVPLPEMHAPPRCASKNIATIFLAARPTRLAPVTWQKARTRSDCRSEFPDNLFVRRFRNDGGPGSVEYFCITMAVMMTRSRVQKLRSLAIAAVILLAALACTIFWLGNSRFWSKNGSGRTSNNAAAQVTGGRDGSRTEASTAIANGRFDQAYAFYRLRQETEWSADDCFKLGSALVERKRLVLGWAALEAARRIDPKHAPSVRALDVLQGKLSLATGSERASLHEAASRGELLRLIGQRSSAGYVRPGPRPVCGQRRPGR